MSNLKWNGQKVAAEIQRIAGLGLTAAAIHLTTKIKEVLSVPAPRKLVMGRKGTSYYRATTPATPGAPPRKLSGRLRTSITKELNSEKTVARVGTNVIYSRRHELGSHKFLVPTLQREASNLAVIIGRTAAGQVGTS